MKRRRRLLLALGATPLLAKLPYLINAFRTSPFDRGQLAAWGAAAALAVFAAAPLRRALRAGGGGGKAERAAAWAAGAAGVAGYAAGVAMGINALQLAAGMGIWWAVALRLYGGRFALLLAPALAAGMFALPGAGGWGAGAVKAKVSITAYDAFRPRFPSRAGGEGGLLGRELPPGEGEGGFGGVAARRFRYAAGERTFDVIEMEPAGGAGGIHPPAHCLRSSGWRVEAERLMGEEVGGRRVQYSELVASRGVERRLVRAWYSSGEESTGSFVRFRTQYREGEGWVAYLASTAIVGEGGVQVAREALSGLLWGVAGWGAR